MGSRIQRAIIQLIIHSFCLEPESLGLARFISCVINMFYCEHTSSAAAAWTGGKVTWKEVILSEECADWLNEKEQN